MRSFQKTVEAFLAAENERKWSICEQFIHEEVEYHLIGEDAPVRGKKNYMDRMKKTYVELSDWKFTIMNLLSTTDRVIVEFDGRGNFKGRYEEKEYEGTPLRLSAVCIFQEKEGLIGEEREYWDPIGFEKQLKRKTD